MIDVGHSSDVRSVYRAFLMSAGQFAERPFLRAPRRSAGDPVEWTYASARNRVLELRNVYAARGLHAADRVALAYDSRVDIYLHLLALNALGVSIVPLNMAGSDNEVRYVIEQSDASLIATLEMHRNRLGNIVATTGDCVLIDDNEFGVAPDAVDTAVDAETEAALLYTSGTTGKPKGCMLSNEYFMTLGEWYTGLDGLCRLQHTDRLATPLPPNHMNALCTSFMGVMMAGGCLVQLDRFHPSSWWQTLRDERATVIHYLGVMPAILLTMPADAGDSFAGQIRFGFGAGSDPRHQAVFEERFGFPLIEAWAMTETGAGALTIADHEPRHVGQRCIGKAVPGMEYRLVDEQDQDVASGEAGELLVRRGGAAPRKGFFSGYFKDEAATAGGWQGGWWHTGDVVRAGPDGSLFFVDRRKNVIRRSGENIAAVEVEATLLASTAVSNCAVTAVPDEMRGDEVFALVVAADKAHETDDNAEQLFKECMRRLAYFKAPGYIAFVDELPLTGSQKVRRGDVKRLAHELVAAGQCIDLRSRKKRHS